MIEAPKPSRPKLRRDLGWIAQADSHSWIVEDPVSASFFKLSDLEQVAASYMNGQRNLAEIAAKLCQRFPTLGVDQTWVVSLSAKLRSYNLLVANSTGDARRLLAVRKAGKSRGIVGQILSPLAIKIPLFDPSGWLQNLQRPAGLLFQRGVVALWIFFGLIAFYFVLRQLLISHFSLAAQLQAVSGDRLLLLGVSYLVAKSLHELGHGLACTYHRTKCNEMGVMLLCLAPCLYCDTTDSWRLPSKWSRAGIAAAGMYVELILATLAACLWLVTVQGALHDVAASVMVVCSVGTVLVNSNPMLRYDGYFILSDVWGVPNLAERSRAALQALIAWGFTGQRPDSREFPKNVWLLALYGIASGVYRLFVLCLILWVCWQVTVPMGLGFVAIFVSFSVLLGVALAYVRSARSLARECKARGNVRPVRFSVAIGLLGAFIYVVCQIPLPDSVLARGVTDYQDKIPIFADRTAQVAFIAPAGQIVSKGEPILELQSPESELELVTLQGEISQLRQELEQLEMRRAIDPLVAYQLPVRQEKLLELLSRESTLVSAASALRKFAAHEGVMLAGEAIIQPSVTAHADDRFSSGPADPANLGCWVERGSLLGWFSGQQVVVVNAILSDDDVRQLEMGAAAEVCWDSQPGRQATGRITRIATEAITETPLPLVGDARLISARGESGRLQPESPHYEVTIRVDEHRRPPLGSPVSVRFRTQPKTLAARAAAAIKRNLKPIY